MKHHSFAFALLGALAATVSAQPASWFATPEPVAWLATTPAKVTASKGDVVMLGAVPYVAHKERLIDWHAQTRLKFGGEEYVLSYSSDTSMWRRDAYVSGYVTILENVRTHAQTIGTGYQHMDYPMRFEFVMPHGQRPKALRIFRIFVKAWPKAMGEEFPIEVVHVSGKSEMGTAAWIKECGRWTHQLALGGDAPNCEWHWTKDGKPVNLEGMVTGLNNCGILVIPGFDPTRDSGTYTVTFTFVTHPPITRTFRVSAAPR